MENHDEQFGSALATSLFFFELELLRLLIISLQFTRQVGKINNPPLLSTF